MPIRSAGKPVGAVEFLFDRENALDDELAAIASTAAGLAEQALERARLYERERETSRALERILQVAPRFYAETTAQVTEAVCREARVTFGADYGVLWRIRGDDLELAQQRSASCGVATGPSRAARRLPGPGGCGHEAGRLVRT